MTPDLGQGGCSALEDAVILARCLAEAMVDNSSVTRKNSEDEVEYDRIKSGLKNYAKSGLDTMSLNGLE